MSNFSHGTKGKILIGTVANPNTPTFELTQYLTDASNDTSIDTEEQTTMGSSQTMSGAKSFLYGNNDETGQMSCNFDKQGVLLRYLDDVKDAGQEDSDFNVVCRHYPAGDKPGHVFIQRPIKIRSYNWSGGIAKKWDGQISFQRSGDTTIGNNPV